jgi:putative ABC transport system permease protein
MIVDALAHDARYAVRYLRRSPRFAIAAVLTLAFGIGANTAIFTMLNALVLQRLPIPDPDGLISLSSWNARGVQRAMPLAMVDELTRDSQLGDVCGYNGGFTVAVEANATPMQAIAAFITGRCPTTFGVVPILGRPFSDGDTPAGAPGNRVALISHAFWTKVFGADPAVIGKSIRAEGVELSIAGVLPRGFGGLQIDAAADIYAPFDTIFPAPSNRRPVASDILARLKPGVSFEQAAAEIATRWPVLLNATAPAALPAAEATDLFGPIPKLARMGTGISAYRARYAQPLTLVLVLTLLLLVLACVNLGGLLLTRLTARGTEMAIRLALGGHRWRVAQQMLVENLLLSLTGACLAVPVSFAFTRPLVSFIPAGAVPRTLSFAPDLRVFAATAAAGFVVAVVVSAIPVWFAVRGDTRRRIAPDRTIAGAANRMTRGLLVVQVALSMVLLVGAGLLGRSLYLLQTNDLGIRSRAIMTAKLMQVPSGYRNLDQASYYPALLDRIRSVPGVRAAGLARIFPRGLSDGIGTPTSFVGDASGDVRAYFEAASPGFFETVGIPLLAGRLPTWADNGNSRAVAVVSASLAHALAPDGNIVDRHIRFGPGANTQDIVIVGVVGNATQGNPRLTRLPILYRPALQMGRSFAAPNVVVALDGDMAPVADRLRSVVREGGHEYVQETSGLEELLARAPASERISATLGAVVAALALVIALMGIHGALAYSITRRTREIGVRLAIGAAPADVSRMVIREALTVTAAGVAVGVPLAYLASRTLGALMFAVSAADTITFGVTAVVLLALGLATSIVPARRAAGIDPAAALRAN